MNFKDVSTWKIYAVGAAIGFVINAWQEPECWLEAGAPQGYYLKLGDCGTDPPLTAELPVSHPDSVNMASIEQTN